MPPYVLKSTAVTLANAFTRSHLDYYNSLLNGLPKHSIFLLQKVKEVKHFYFTTVTVKLKACMLAIDLSVLPPAELVPTYTAR